MSDTLEISCPCCDTLLVIDPETGAILREERRQKREFQSLDEAIGQVGAKKREAEDKLRRAMEENRNRDDILEKRFQEARRKAEKDPTPPRRPFDDD